MKKEADVVERACRLIEQDPQLPSLSSLADRLEISASHLHRRFKESMGLSPRAFAVALREERLRRELPRARSVTEAAFRAGFASLSRFYERAAPSLGMPARSSRRKGAGETIRFALGRSSLGELLVASSAQGICWIALGDDPEVLLREFEERYAAAALVGDDRDFDAVVALVILCLELPERARDLPLDIRGTAFQKRVWEALLAIPPGTRLSYKELAERLGAPRSARAVAAACAANEIAVAIPCHRVVATDGDLRGYRWGLARKAELLARERASAGTPRDD